MTAAPSRRVSRAIIQAALAAWTCGLVGGCSADAAGENAQTTAGSGASMADSIAGAGGAGGTGGRDGTSNGVFGDAGQAGTAGATGSAGASSDASIGDASQEPTHDAGTNSGDGSGVCPGWEMPAYDSLPRCTNGSCPGGSTTFMCSQFQPSVVNGVPPMTCATVLCPQGTICLEVGVQANCVLPCNENGGQCMAGGRCASGESGADPQGCVPLRCTDGVVECGVVSTCDPDNPQSDSFGCVRMTCSSDADCPCGACEDNLCWERLRRCFRLQFAP